MIWSAGWFESTVGVFRDLDSNIVMKCPICRQTITWEENPNRPFCSERCRLVDLGNWASGQYSVPAEETNTEETDKEEQNVET
jgi:endogenous inhibitor of DNA gyrase (YacG/DUF329 family)